MTLVTVILGDRYRLEDRVAVGGVGEVWRATDLALRRRVAVKRLRADYMSWDDTIARFRAEARHAGGLSHPNIAQIYDYCEDDPPHPPYLVMELVDGPSLASRLTSGPLAPAHVMDIVAQVADGLAAAHAAGLVHRDIKPGNLLLASNGQVKITDFGISHAAGSAPVTRTGTLVGTPAYLAPERVAGASGTPAADLYSLGIVAYECLAGLPPFAGGAVEVALAHREHPLPALSPWVPADAAALITALTAKDPRARPASAGEVAVRAKQARDSLRRGGAAATIPRPRTAISRPRAADVISHPRAAGVIPRPRAAEEEPWRYQPATGVTPTAAMLMDAHLTRNGAAFPSPPAPPSKRWPRWMTAAALAGLVTAGLAGWLLANVFTAAPGRLMMPPAGRSGPVAARTVKISEAALAGLPVSVVREKLRHAGLLVRVLWRRGGRQDPGTVTAVEPTGLVPVGSLVLLTGATTPSSAADPGTAHGPPPGHRRNSDHGQAPGPPGRSRGPGTAPGPPQFDVSSAGNNRG